MLLVVFLFLACARSTLTPSDYQQSFSGDGTYYGDQNPVGTGNCGYRGKNPAWVAGWADYFVAINQPQYGESGDACGACIEGTASGKGLGAKPIKSTFKAYVVDRCPECQKGSLDLAAKGDGRWDITWKFVPCPVSGPVWVFFEGTNPWYTKMRALNMPYPIASVELTTANGVVKPKKTQDNAWEGGGFGQGFTGKKAKLTNIMGSTIELVINVGDTYNEDVLQITPSGGATQPPTTQPPTTQPPTTQPPTTQPPTTGALSVNVVGKNLVDASGKPLLLHGVNRAGFEYACAQNWGFSDGPVDKSTVDVMKTWKINVVRLPLNEGCWLGIGVSAERGGNPYRQAVKDYIKLINDAGMYVIIDLHWGSTGPNAPKQQQIMSGSNAAVFWKSVATEFLGNTAIIFDLFNEPNSIDWDCWKSGCANAQLQVLGMQELVNAVRSVSKDHVLLLGGLRWANDLSRWLEFLPVDPAKKLAASFHVYNFNECKDTGCWDAQVGPIARSFPVIVGEVGQDDCKSDFAIKLFQWADANGVSYLAWQWSAAAACNGPSLITNYDGSTTGFGAGVKEYYLAHNGDNQQPTTTTTTITTTTQQPSATTTTQQPVSQPPVANLFWIFREGNLAAFDNWSWGVVASKDASSRPGDRSVVLQISISQTWAGYQLATPGASEGKSFDVSNYDTFTFDVFPTNDNQKLAISFSGANGIGKVDIPELFPKNQWTSKTIDLNSLVKGKDFRTFFIQDVSQRNDNKFYLDNIGFLSSGLSRLGSSAANDSFPMWAIGLTVGGIALLVVAIVVISVLVARRNKISKDLYAPLVQ